MGDKGRQDRREGGHTMHPFSGTLAPLLSAAVGGSFLEGAAVCSGNMLGGVDMLVVVSLLVPRPPPRATLCLVRD